MLGRCKRDATLILQIKNWACECLPIQPRLTCISISFETDVHIMELECYEPGGTRLESGATAEC